MTTTLELAEYYAGLLILQYIGRPKAWATIKAQATPVIMPQTSVQTITFALAPTAGAFTLSYNGNNSASINWNDSAATVQMRLRAITDLELVIVTGSIADGTLKIRFEGVTAPALSLEVTASTLVATAIPIIPLVMETDLTLPLAIQDGFNLSGNDLAIGKQLDTLGKYAGVARTAQGFTSQITLDDTDYVSLIRLGILHNSSGSSLSEIQQLLHTFFPDQLLVFDYQNMQMNYLLSSSIGSQNLVELFITQGLLPRPMAVQISLIIYAPDITHFFGFRTYELPPSNNTPFNTYEDYHTDWPWLAYQNALTF
jgi:hypothetical protein